MSKETAEFLEVPPSAVGHADPVSADQTTQLEQVAPLGVRDMFDALDRVAMRWEGVIHSLLESHAVAASVVPEPLAPLPQWAVDRLRRAGAYGETGDRYRQYRTMVHEALQLASGEGSSYRYELWDLRPQGRVVRLERRHETLFEAHEALPAVQAKYPKAFISQVHVDDTHSSAVDPALLDTLIGRVWHAGTIFGRGGDYDLFEVQDTTGRTVTVPANVLRAHACFERLSTEAKESLEDSLARSARKRERREEEAARKGGEA